MNGSWLIMNINLLIVVVKNDYWLQVNYSLNTGSG